MDVNFLILIVTNRQNLQFYKLESAKEENMNVNTDTVKNMVLQTCKIKV